MVLFFFNRSTKSRKQKARHAAEEHRRQLQALLLNKNPSRRSVNGINGNEDLHDDGTELLGTSTFDIKVANIFLCGHSFAGLVFIKFWLECWKAAESLLGT